MSSNHHDIEKGSSSPVHANHPSTAFPPRIPGGHIANPATLGLFSFASTTFILSMYNADVRDIHTPNIVVGMAVFCGGLAQLLAGMWEFPKGNTFGATAFTSYGAFWMSYATIHIPGSGIAEAYTSGSEERSAVGIYLMAWFIVTTLFFITALRKSIAFITLFGLLSITFLMLGCADFSGNTKLTQAGGGLGIATALVAYYIGMAELLAAEKKAIVRLPLGAFKHD